MFKNTLIAGLFFAAATAHLAAQGTVIQSPSSCVNGARPGTSYIGERTLRCILE